MRENWQSNLSRLVQIGVNAHAKSTALFCMAPPCPLPPPFYQRSGWWTRQFGIRATAGCLFELVADSLVGREKRIRNSIKNGDRLASFELPLLEYVRRNNNDGDGSLVWLTAAGKRFINDCLLTTDGQMAVYLENSSCYWCYGYHCSFPSLSLSLSLFFRGQCESFQIDVILTAFSLSICRLDEIEILMQDLDRSNQVGPWRLTLLALTESCFWPSYCVPNTWLSVVNS